MKTNARNYLIRRAFGVFGNIILAERVKMDTEKKEKIDVKLKNGFVIQVIDKRDQYEEKRRMASYLLPATTE